MKITSLNKAMIRRLANEFEDAMNEVAKKYGVEVDYKSARFTSDNGTLKYEVSTIGNDGTLNTREVSNLNRYGKQYGLSAEDLGRKFEYRNEVYEITGLNPRAHKYPVCARRLRDGKGFKFPLAYIRTNAFARLTRETKNELVYLDKWKKTLGFGHADMQSRSTINKRWKLIEERIGRSIPEHEVRSWKLS